MILHLWTNLAGEGIAGGQIRRWRRAESNRPSPYPLETYRGIPTSGVPHVRKLQKKWWRAITRPPPVQSVKSEAVLGRDLQKSSSQLLRGIAEAGSRVDGSRCKVSSGKDHRRLRGVASAEAVKRMVEEVKCRNAKTKIARLAKAKALLRRQIGVPEGRPVRVRKDVLAISAGSPKQEPLMYC